MNRVFRSFPLFSIFLSMNLVGAADLPLLQSTQTGKQQGAVDQTQETVSGLSSDQSLAVTLNSLDTGSIGETGTSLNWFAAISVIGTVSKNSNGKIELRPKPSVYLKDNIVLGEYPSQVIKPLGETYLISARKIENELKNILGKNEKLSSYSLIVSLWGTYRLMGLSSTHLLGQESWRSEKLLALVGKNGELPFEIKDSFIVGSGMHPKLMGKISVVSRTH